MPARVTFVVPSALAVCLAAGLLVACRPAAPVEQRPLVVALHSAPLSFDPHAYNEVLTFSVLSNVHEGLTTFDQRSNVQPALAEWWENPDDLTWRFHLRPGVRFHDGSSFDAEDVVASLERARRSAFASYLVEVDEVRLIDELTVDVVTGRPFSILLNKLAFVLVMPAGAEPAAGPVPGTGPYRYAGGSGDAALRLAAWEGYWGETARIPGVVFVAEVDPERRVDRLLAGEVAAAQDLTPAAAARVRARPGVRVEAVDSLIVEYLYMRQSTPPFDDRRVRQAIDLALDRDALVAEMVGGLGRPANQMVGRDVFGFAPELPERRRDLAAARRLLAAAGYPDGLEVTLAHRDSRDGGVIAAQLAEAGIRVDLAPGPWGELFGRLSAGEISFYYGGLLAPSADASDFFDTNAHSRDPVRGYGQSNYGNYHNPEVDRLVEETGTAFEMISRRNLLQSAMRLVMEDLVYLPLFVPAEVWGVDERLEWRPRHDSFFRAREATWRE